MIASGLENGAETSDPLFSKFMDTSTPHMHFWPFELSPFRPPSYTLSCFLLICPFFGFLCEIMWINMWKEISLLPREAGGLVTRLI